MRQTPKILVVDDDIENVQLLEAILRRDGYEVVTTTDAVKVYDLVLQAMPDLVMLDVKMPQADGWEIAERLGLAETTQNLPLIFVSGVVLDGPGIARALDRGANDFITKPFDATEVRARVRACLRHKRVRDELIEKSKLLEIRATIDEHTGLFNRRLLYDRLRAELTRSKRYQYPTTCLILDIDDLKLTNDKLGEQAGNKAISELANILRGVTRGYDILARYASDEFAIILPQVKPDQGFKVAERLRRRVETHTFAVGDTTASLTISIGLAAFPGDGEEVEDLLQAAESALLAAKQLGKNRSCVFGTPTA